MDAPGPEAAAKEGRESKHTRGATDRNKWLPAQRTPSVHSTEAGALGKRWFSPFLSEGPIFGDTQFPHFRAQ